MTGGDGSVAVGLYGVTKRFGNMVAVDDVTIEVAQGEFFSLLGPSGCGKTTSLRMIAGFEEPDSGRVVLGDRDIVGVPPYKRNVNTVFQSYALFPHMTVFDNVAFGLRRKKIPSSEIREKVPRYLALVQLDGYEKRRPAQLSGGQQQRVALARALINEPAVLLLDEPLGALDLKLRKQMQLELMRIQREVGVTFIYVTHDQEEALVMSDRLAVMSYGHVEQIGYPEDIYERPATRFVAGFIGTSNIVETNVTGRAGDLLELEAGPHDRLLVEPPPDRALRPGDPLAFTVRPEKLLIAPDGRSGRGRAVHRRGRRRRRRVPRRVDPTRGEDRCGIDARSIPPEQRARQRRGDARNTCQDRVAGRAQRRAGRGDQPRCSTRRDQHRKELTG